MFEELDDRSYVQVSKEEDKELEALIDAFEGAPVFNVSLDSLREDVYNKIAVNDSEFGNTTKRTKIYIVDEYEALDGKTVRDVKDIESALEGFVDKEYYDLGEIIDLLGKSFEVYSEICVVEEVVSSNIFDTRKNNIFCTRYNIVCDECFELLDNNRGMAGAFALHKIKIGFDYVDDICKGLSKLRKEKKISEGMYIKYTGLLIDNK
jgi:hypothetical protein